MRAVLALPWGVCRDEHRCTLHACTLVFMRKTEAYLPAFVQSPGPPCQPIWFSERACDIQATQAKPTEAQLAKVLPSFLVEQVTEARDLALMRDRRCRPGLSVWPGISHLEKFLPEPLTGVRESV